MLTGEQLGAAIRAAIELKGVSQVALAAHFGVKPPSVQDWIRRGTISKDKLPALWAYFGDVVGPSHWGLEGTPSQVGLERQGQGHLGTSNVLSGPDIRGKVPLISWVRAGSFCEAADPFTPGDAERWMDCPVNHSETTFALRVRGDSMTAPHGNGRTYPEGCIIFVDPERRSPVNGDRIVACLDGSHEVTFKVYKNEDGRQWLQPLNPTHEPIRLPFKVLGTVLGKWEDG